MPDRGSFRSWAAPAAVLVAAIVVYLPSFEARFFLDDFRIILENPALHDVLDPAAIWAFSPARFVGSWTMAANYTLHGDSVFGFHLVNLLIHLGAGLALYLFARAAIRAPALPRPAPAWLTWLPLLAAAIYLLHPLQTQAVTYIVQRYTSLMALFYLGSMAAFAWGRLRGSAPLYLVSLGLAGLAILSKQSAATLPAALLLVELLLFRTLTVRARATVGVAGAAAVLAAAWLVTLPALDAVGITRETNQVGRIDYLATQMEVLWRYIGLFLMIGEQRLDYDIPIASGFADAGILLATAGHVGLISCGIALWRRSPLAAFAILFYYLAHAVESSFFPIIDEAFEHRSYLPNAGLAMLAGMGLAWLAGRLVHWRAGAALALAVLLLLGGSTYARNALWADRIAFLEAETRLSPGNERAWTSLGKELMREGRFRDALDALEQAQDIALARNDGRLRPPTILNMIFALHYTGRNRDAIELANNTPTAAFSDSERASLLEARGRARLELGNAAAAQADLMRAARLDPTPNIVAFLAAAELRLGNRARARSLAEQVLRAAPSHPLARRIERETR